MARTYTAGVMVRFKPADRRRLQQRADAEGRTSADLARHLVRQALDAKEPSRGR